MDVPANTAAFIRDAFDAAVVEYGDFDLAPEAFQAAVVEREPDEAAIRELRLADLYLVQGCLAGHDEAWRMLRKLHRAQLIPSEKACALLATYPATEPLRDWLVAGGMAPPRRRLHLLWIGFGAIGLALLALSWKDRSGEPTDAELTTAFAALREAEPELFKGVYPLLAENRASPRQARPDRAPDTALRVRIHRGLRTIDRLVDPRVRHVARAHFLIRLEQYDAAAAELRRAPPSALVEETRAWLRSSRE